MYNGAKVSKVNSNSYTECLEACKGYKRFGKTCIGIIYKELSINFNCELKRKINFNSPMCNLKSPVVFSRRCDLDVPKPEKYCKKTRKYFIIMTPFLGRSAFMFAS